MFLFYSMFNDQHDCGPSGYGVQRCLRAAIMLSIRRYRTGEYSSPVDFDVIAHIHQLSNNIRLQSALLRNVNSTVITMVTTVLHQ